MKVIKAVLFEGRHDHPEIQGLPSVFPSDVNPLDFEALDREAKAFRKRYYPDNGYIIYVTGLTSAVVAVIKMCIDYSFDLVLMHYDKARNTYVPHPVLTSSIDWKDDVVPSSMSMWELEHRAPEIWNALRKGKTT